MKSNRRIKALAEKRARKRQRMIASKRSRYALKKAWLAGNTDADNREPWGFQVPFPKPW